MSNELHVNPADISTYAGRLSAWGMTATVAPMQDLTQMGPLAFGAFQGITDAGRFAEGAMMVAAVQSNVTLFDQFVKDVGVGVQAIANAAQVCADGYRSTDAENADGIGMVNYAFADPSAARPSGLSSLLGGETLSQLRVQAMAGGAGAQPQVMTNPDGGTVVVSGTGYTLTTYPDGSTRTITTTNPTAATTLVKTESLGPDGAVLSTHTEKTEEVVGSVGGGTVVTTETVEAGGLAAGTIVATSSDGTKTIRTTRNGRPTDDPAVTVAPQGSRSSSDAGPVQQAVEVFGDEQSSGVAGINYGDARQPTWTDWVQAPPDPHDRLWNSAPPPAASRSVLLAPVGGQSDGGEQPPSSGDDALSAAG